MIEVNVILSVRKKCKLQNLIDELDRYKRFIRHLKKDKKNWIFINEKEFLFFKPIKIDKYTNEYLFKHADISIFTSATILDQRLFKNG